MGLKDRKKIKRAVAAAEKAARRKKTLKGKARAFSETLRAMEKKLKAKKRKRR